MLMGIFVLLMMFFGACCREYGHKIRTNVDEAQKETKHFFIAWLLFN